MKRAIVAALLVAAAVVVYSPPAQAARATDKPVITIDGGTSGADVANIAADWSKNTGVTVVPGECTGQEDCVTITVLPPGVAPCGVVLDMGTVNGCAQDHQATQTCDVTINNTIANDYLTFLYVAKHEVGHCIWALGPATPWYGHLDDKRAIMYAQMLGYPQHLSDATLTSVDRSWSRSLFG